MSTINRLLSRRDKHAHGSHKDKIKSISHRLSRAGINNWKDADIAYVLNGAYSSGDPEKAYELLMLLEDSEEGIIQNYNPDVKLLGAINREGVTCYLDALLFAMFARLGSFEAMLYKNFEDPPRKKLATLLRLWVNTLRAGKLITTDILQLADCGWKDAAELCQQDSSEAFTFITSTLALPLLTLKMDIFHTGREDVADDHKFVNERLLELAVPEDTTDGHVITLEECLELYFNNKIEVKRYLDMLERRNTLNSVRSHQSVDSTKGHASHVEVAELSDVSQPSSPMLPPESEPIPISPRRPTFQRKRAPSIIQEHYVSEKHGMMGSPQSTDEKGPQSGRVRKEVMMPAWQFFSLIPWYTNNMPSSDAQVAAHFSSTRPILGICLKRYGVSFNGIAFKRTTVIDIPLEIGLPHFIQDDKMADDGPAFGNFKLSLQSVVCHRGLSVESGHYISLVRSPDSRQQGEDQWLRFDDLARERVTDTNVEQFLREESPYLLFYQVVPIEGDPGNITNGEHPPAYSMPIVSEESKIRSDVAGVDTSPRVSYTANEHPNAEAQRPSVEIQRPSTDTSTSDGPRGRSSMQSERANSVVFSNASDTSFKPDLLNTSNMVNGQTDGPNTLTASRRGSKTTKASSNSRPNSRADDKRTSTSLSRLASRMSRDKSKSPIAPQTQALPSNQADKEDSVPDPPPQQVKDPTTGTMGPPAPLVSENEKPVDRARLKKETKERSKAGHRDHQHLIKARRKDGKPERECAVM
ncbi:hypothetical protein P7C71_g5491, partial [Lecanoromycetidae sp. Uapishka_2]